MTIEKPGLNKRHMARTYAMQALYMWNFTQESPDALFEDFIADYGLPEQEVDGAYFKTLLLGTLLHREALDNLIASKCNRKLSLLNPVELAVLRLATFEFVHCPEVPYAVVMNEAIELAKKFGAVEGYKYVNGVLNSLVPELRKSEM